MGKKLAVERIDLADTGHPKQLADLLIAQIQDQLPQLLPLPIEEVAKACGIDEIRTLQTDGFEGGLIQNNEKTKGFILTKAGIRDDRRRFTVAHELGHFLNPYHQAPAGSEQLLCTSEHLRASGKQRNDRLGMEAQANEFAANVLMPQQQLRKRSSLWGSPQIQSILNLHVLCLVSKEAAARRYVELHGDPCAVVFSRNGTFRYAVYGGGFPFIEGGTNIPIGRKTLTHSYMGALGEISDQDDCDPHAWLRANDAKRWKIWEEVLIQQDGYRMTLLLGEMNSYDEDEHLERRWTPKFR